MRFLLPVLYARRLDLIRPQHFLLWFVDQDVDELGRSLKGFEDSFCPFVLPSGMRDKHQRLAFGVLEVRSEILCGTFLNVPALVTA
jgi:hypothetical protein